MSLRCSRGEAPAADYPMQRLIVTERVHIPHLACSEEKKTRAVTTILIALSYNPT